MRDTIDETDKIVDEFTQAENPWLREDDRGPRSESMLISYAYGNSNYVIVAPCGKDVHHSRMNAEELDNYIEALQIYRKYMGKI